MRSLMIDGQPVNLRKDDTIRFVYENPFISEDRVPIPASMDFQLDPTPLNLQVFDNPNRLTSKLKVAEKPATFMFGPITFFDGVAKYNGFDDKIKLHLRSVDKANLAKNLCDLTLDRVNFREGTRYSYYQDPRDPILAIKGWGNDSYMPVFNDAAAGNRSWVWGPVQIANEDNDALNYIGLSAYFENGKDVTRGRNGTYCRNPYPRVHYLFDIIFDGLLVNNPLKADRFKNLVVPTMFHKDYPTIRTNYALGQFVLDNAVHPQVSAPVEMLYFDLSSFMPAYKSSTFVKETLKMLGMVLYPVSRKYVIKTVEEIVTGTTVIDWSDKLIGKLESEVVAGQIFNLELNDIEEVEGATIKVENGIDIFSIPSTIDEPYLVEVTSTGEVFEITMSKVDVVDSHNVTTTYTVYNVEVKRAFNSAPTYVKTEEDKFTVSIQLKPYESNFTIHPSLEREVGRTTAGLKMKDKLWYVAKNFTDMKPRDYTPSILHYCGVNDSLQAGKMHPILTSHAYDCRGRKVADFSLEPWGTDGIVNKFYPSYRTWVERPKKRITGDFLLRAIDLANIDLSLKYSCNNVNFFIEKVEVDVAHDRILPARVTMIEA